MRTICFALALALALALTLTLPAFADVISYQATYSGSTTETAGNQFTISGGLDIPLFDPALGVLNSISFIVDTHPGSSWPVISRSQSQTPFSEFDATTATSILGFVATYREASIYTPNGVLPCGIVGGNQITSQPCADIRTSFGQADRMTGQITDGSSSVAFTPWGGEANRQLTGTPPTDLSTFIGVGEQYLPFSVTAAGYFDMTTENIGGMSRGSVSEYLYLTYNYTPVPMVESALVATPEPRTFIPLVAMVTFLFAWRLRRYLVQTHVL